MRLLIISLISILFSHPAFSGGTVGNGGDIYAIEFVSMAKTVLKELQAVDTDLIDLEYFDKTIRTTTIESTDQKLYLNAVLIDAINYPESYKIVFNRDSWILANERTRMIFVLHEYLGIMRRDDSMYRVSTQALQIVKNDTFVCLSVAQNHFTDFQVTGRAAFDLNKTSEKITWSDSMKTYTISMNRQLGRLFFHLYVYDNGNAEAGKQEIRTSLNPFKPSFYFYFPIQTNKTLKNHPITDLTMDCG